MKRPSDSTEFSKERLYLILNKVTKLNIYYLILESTYDALRQII